MLKLHSFEGYRASTKGRTGTWYELAPGEDNGRHMASDSVFFWIDEWELVAEPLLANRFARYDRHDRATISSADWVEPLTHLEDVCRRLRAAEEAPHIHVTASDLPKNLRDVLHRNFPAARDQLVLDLEEVSSWCWRTLRRCGCITIIGL